jgi:uncharacterized protein (UPF0548 family)
MFALRLPTSPESTKFLEQQRNLPFTYAPLDASRTGMPVNGFDNDYQRVIVGKGSAAWAAAQEKMRNWEMFPSDWTIILPVRAPIQEEQTVAMYARAFGAWWRNSCRVVYTIDEPERFGFAYGTLPGHMECGEELFLLEKDADGTVWYTIRAFSKPRHWLARLGYPAMRYFQARFRRDSAKAMQV